jgi:hypothetical protein
MIDLEHQVQKAICQYLDLRGVCYFAIPNGGKRKVREGEEGMTQDEIWEKVVKEL